jgi:hypothetical protein
MIGENIYFMSSWFSLYRRSRAWPEGTKELPMKRENGSGRTSEFPQLCPSRQ